MTGNTGGTFGSIALAAAAGGAVFATGGAAAVPLALATGAGVAAQGFAMQAVNQGEQAQQKQLKLAAEKERLASRQRAIAIRQELADTIGQQRALIAARGQGSGVGSGQYIERFSQRNAGLDLSVNAANLGTDLRANKLEVQQSKLRNKASLIRGLGDMTGSTVGAFYQARDLR